MDIHRQMSYTKIWQKHNAVPLINLITNFFEDEIINDYKCEKCKRKGINKSHEIVEFPHYLIILIKRFVFFPQPQKLENKIEFEEQLEISDLYSDFT